MKKLYLITLIVLFCYIVSAEPLTVTHELLTPATEPGKIITFGMKIRNDMLTDDTFIISKDEFGEFPFSDVIESISIEPAQIDLSAHESQSVIVKFKILDDAVPGKNYKTFVKIKSLQNPEIKVKHDFIIDVVSPEEIIDINTNFPDKIIPGKDIVFQISFKNTANLLLDPVDIYIVSDLFSKQYKEKFYAYQEVTKDLSFKLDKTTKEGKYTLGIKVYKDNKLKGNLVKEFLVLTNPDIEEKIVFDYGLFSKKKTITKTNHGNINVEESYSLKLNSFQSMLTKFDKTPNKIIGNNFEWIFNIKPGESYSIVITYYYNLFYIIILLLVVLGLIYLWFSKRKLLVKKSILRIKKSDKEDLLRFKVMIHLKNNTGRKINNIKVMDVLPNIIKSTREYGTLKPDKIQKGEKSSRLVWEIDSLESGEERILSYNIVSGLKIFGKFGLPPTIVKYKNKYGKIIMSNSNRVISLV
jgi:hypothetical protein